MCHFRNFNKWEAPQSIDIPTSRHTYLPPDIPTYLPACLPTSRHTCVCSIFSSKRWSLTLIFHIPLIFCARLSWSLHFRYNTRVHSVQNWRRRYDSSSLGVRQCWKSIWYMGWTRASLHLERDMTPVHEHQISRFLFLGGRGAEKCITLHSKPRLEVTKSVRRKSISCQDISLKYCKYLVIATTLEDERILFVFQGLDDRQERRSNLKQKMFK